MNIKSPMREEVLSQIKYLERNISNGSAAYRLTRVNRLRSLKSSLAF
jgi:hypothetical protein